MKPSPAARFLIWITATTATRPLRSYRIMFAAIWLVYDLIDLSQGQLKQVFELTDLKPTVEMLTVLQIELIACEVFLLFGYMPRLFALLAAMARAAEMSLFHLNDFAYVVVCAMILAQFDWPRTRDTRSLAWPRDLLLLQTVWIYFASAAMKLNPEFLSGGDLFVRHNYTASILPLPYPDFFRGWIASMAFNQVLAWLTVVLEFTMALALLSWWFRPKLRHVLRPVALVMAVAIHGYAAFALNVYFFGLSLCAQIYFLTAQD